jgi:hypothetical protein
VSFFAYIISWVLSLVGSLVFIPLESNYKFSIFNVFNILNHSLFNRLSYYGFFEITRIIFLIIIPFFSLGIAFKIFYRKSDYIGIPLFSILNGVFYGIINLILSFVITYKMLGTTVTFASFYTFINTFIIIALLTVVLCYLISHKKQAFKENDLTYLLKPLGVLALIITGVTIVILTVQLRDLLSLRYLLGLIVLLPNLVAYSFLLVFGVPLNIDIPYEVKVNILGVRTFFQSYYQFALVGVFIFLFTLFILFVSFYKIYKKDKENYSTRALKSSLWLAVINFGIAIYSRQTYYMEDRFHIGGSPIVAFFITLILLVVVAFVVYLVAELALAKKVNGFYQDFKILIFIMVIVFTTLFAGFGHYFSKDGGDVVEIFYPVGVSIYDDLYLDNMDSFNFDDNHSFERFFEDFLNQIELY